MKTRNQKSKTIPIFRNEDEERDFWAKYSVLDFPEFFKPVKLDFSKLKPSSEKITLRLPKMLLDSIKMMANKKDVPYQSYLKILLSEKVREEERVLRISK